MSFLNSLPLSSQAATASGLATDVLAGTFLPAASGAFPSLDQLGSVVGSITNKTTGLAAFLNNPVGYSTAKIFGGRGDTIARIVTGLLGLLLIAAAIFTHPTVIEVGKKVGKAAAAAGVAAA